MTPEEITLVALVITTSVSSITHFLPHLADVRHSTPDSTLRQDVRLGELAAAGVALGVGGTLGMLMKRRAPFVVAVAVVAFLVIIYEYASTCEGNS